MQTADIEPKADTITNYLQSDHRRLDGLFEACRARAGAGQLGEAERLFVEFRTGLLRHIKIEENIVFPEFEAATGLDRTTGPTGVMRFEHSEIIRMLDLIRDHFVTEAPDPDEFERLRRALLGILHGHNDKEERILYPMSDRMIPSRRLRSLVDLMRSLT